MSHASNEISSKTGVSNTMYLMHASLEDVPVFMRGGSVTQKKASIAIINMLSILTSKQHARDTTICNQIHYNTKTSKQDDRWKRRHPEE
jgi:hypothetical protein